MANHPLGELLENEPMSKHVTWRAGGIAARYFKPENKASLIEYVASLPASEELFWLGLGSNLLVRDGGFHGTMIAVTGRLNEITQLDEESFYVEAGVTCAKVAKITARAGLTGAEFLAGIPGTMGGALAMNAGAFGFETWPNVRQVEMLTKQGEVQIRSADTFSYGYRHVDNTGEGCFLSAELVLRKAEDDKGHEKIRHLLAKRGQSQPISKPTCGSVFTNPDGHYAAQLIESVGLKGYCIGGACVSEKHANFIENTGSATAGDIEQLILFVQSKIQDKTGILLHPEVMIVGNYP
jgi:UDP-N-acetylmuramate dehydrogenase